MTKKKGFENFKSTFETKYILITFSKKIFFAGQKWLGRLDANRGS